jgi:hypothetical protein
MIDTMTGNLLIDSLPLSLGPSFTRRQFLSSPLAQGARVLLANEPYCTYVTPAYTISGLSFIISLSFFGELLEDIGLEHTAPELGASWSDWSEEKEQRRKQIHDQWLTKQIGAERRVFDWGAVSSFYDAKTGGSDIIIRYRYQGKPWHGKAGL